MRKIVVKNMTNKIDRRAVRTKQNIVNAFIQLLEEKPFNKITVAEIAEVADINRRTFYLHYEDIFALLDELENELIDEFEEVFETKKPDNLHEFQVELLDFLTKNHQLSQALLASNESEFLGKIMHIVIDAGIVHSEYATEVERQYCWNYIEHGMRSVLLDWITNDSLPQAQMADFTTKLVQSSLQRVKVG